MSFFLPCSTSQLSISYHCPSCHCCHIPSRQQDQRKIQSIMGNDASTMAAKHKFNSTLEEINEGLGALTKEGPTNKKEAKERREQREDEYKKKQR